MRRLAAETGDVNDILAASQAVEAANSARSTLDSIREVLAEKRNHERMADLNARVAAGESLPMGDLMALSQYNQQHMSDEDRALEDKIAEVNTLRHRAARNRNGSALSIEQFERTAQAEGYEDAIAEIKRREAQSHENATAVVDEIMGRRGY